MLFRSARTGLGAVLGGEGERARVQRDMLAAFLVRAVSAAILYLTQIVLARWMGRAEYGIYVAVWTMVLVLGGVEDDEHMLRRIQEEHQPSVTQSGDSRQSSELRTYGIGAQIIVDMGIRKMRVLSAPKRMTGLAGFGLEVVEYVECDPALTLNQGHSEP